VARTAYVDHSPPRERQVIPTVPVRDRGAGRPTKKDRRELDRLRSSWEIGPTD
jgi:ribosome-associated heat shock protein Hsp15